MVGVARVQTCISKNAASRASGAFGGWRLYLPPFLSYQKNRNMFQISQLQLINILKKNVKKRPKWRFYNKKTKTADSKMDFKYVSDQYVS